MQALEDAIDRQATEVGSSGVVRVDRGSTTEVARPYGLADRAHGILDGVLGT